jgi:hypothetical protein
MILNKKGQKNSDYLAPIYLRRYSMGEAESGQIITPPSPLICGRCYSDFASTEVVPQFDENGIMTSVVFNIVGGEEAMPEINEMMAPWWVLVHLGSVSAASTVARAPAAKSSRS